MYQNSSLGASEWSRLDNGPHGIRIRCMVLQNTFGIACRQYGYIWIITQSYTTYCFYEHVKGAVPLRMDRRIISPFRVANGNLENIKFL